MGQVRLPPAQQRSLPRGARGQFIYIPFLYKGTLLPIIRGSQEVCEGFKRGCTAVADSVHSGAVVEVGPTLTGQAVPSTEESVGLEATKHGQRAQSVKGHHIHGCLLIQKHAVSFYCSGRTTCFTSNKAKSSGGKLHVQPLENSPEGVLSGNSILPLSKKDACTPACVHVCVCVCVHLF